MPLSIRLFLIISSIMIINTLINGHITYFYIGKAKPEFDSLLLRIIVTIWGIVICLSMKQYKKLKDTFCLLSINSLRTSIHYKESYILEI